MNPAKWEAVDTASTQALKTEKLVIPEGTLYRCYFAYREDSGVSLVFVPKREENK